MFFHTLNICQFSMKLFEHETEQFQEYVISNSHLIFIMHQRGVPIAHIWTCRCESHLFRRFELKDPVLYILMF